MRVWIDCKTVQPLIGGLLLCLCLFSNAHAVESSFQLKAESSTREADYTLGSIARQHITLHVPPGFELDPASLPAPAQNEAIELRDAHWTTTDSKTERLIHLDIDWQIFVAGDSVRIMPLKKLHLEFKKEQQRLTIDVPADKVIVSSLLPARIDQAHVQLYPDSPLPEWSLAKQLRILAGWLSLAVLSLVYIAWVMGWIQLPQEKNMPFRQAWREIRKLQGNPQEAAKQAMQLISRAMDQFAGVAVTAENLTRVTSTHTVLTAYQTQLQTFYQEIQQAFFAGKPVSTSLADLKQLAKQLSQVELS
jgi:hypothetical protein